MVEYHKREKIAKERGYYVDRDGNAYNRKGHLLKCRLNPTRYWFYEMRTGGKKRKVFVHRLQAYIKYGDSMYHEGTMVRHLDGNPMNNSWDNIAIGNASDNARDIPPEIRKKIALCARKKYPIHQVVEMRKLHEQGMTYKQLMKIYNISSKGTMSFIINNRLV